MLLGIDQSGNFNENEYNAAFKLFNRTVIYPIQKEIKNALKPILDIDIAPFSTELLD